MNLQKTIKAIIKAGGADFYGVADLKPARAAIIDQGGQELAAYPRAVTVGITLMHTIVNALPERSKRTAAINYRLHTYEITNQRLDLLAAQIASALQSAGYDCLPIPASRRSDDTRLCALFSHKLAARLAGLGWIGKSCLFVTPAAGPRVRWVSVLTTAPLASTGQAMQERCGSCTACLDICPVHAFTGQPFRPGEPREMRYAADKCDRYFNRMRETDKDTAVCGLCVYICPYGRKR